MRALRLLAGAGATLLTLAIAVGLFVGISALVLYVTGRILPLAGRRRRE